MDTIGSGGEADRIDTDTDKAPSHMINQPNPAIVTSSARQQEPDDTTLSLPPLPDNDDSSLLLSSEDGDHDRVEDQTFLQENEMRRRLMDMESSFLPDPSTIQATTTHRTIDADDTSMVEAHRGDAPGTSGPENSQLSFMVPDESNVDITSVGDEVPIPQTPSPRSEEADDEAMDATSAASSEKHVDNATTQIEGTHSSPSAAAALRTASRNPTASSEDPRDANQTSMGVIQREHFSPPEPNQLLQSMGQNSHSEPRNLSPGPSRFFPENSGGDAEAISRASSRRSSRPKYLASRQSAHRLSYSSVTSTGTEITNSDATLGADYALQSGGAAPGMTSSIQAGQRNTLARSVSLGSMASGISGYSDDNVFDRKGPSGTTEGGLHTLNEEDGPSRSRPGSSSQHHHTHQPANHVSEQPSAQEAAEPMTPKAKHRNNSFPTDTAIAERIKDVQIPSTFVKQFREDYGSRALSPDKRTSTTAGFTKSGRTMTLKEQSSTIDRLSKENFDLKMRIHFLNEALNRRSEEGIKEMISENVELKSDKLKLQKDSQHLKRKVRELEKQLKDQQSDKESMVNHDPDGSEDEDRDAAQDEEILFLRERIETYELEIERFRSESIVRESEKRRLAEMVKSLSDGRSEGRPMGSDVGAREERDMWKDMLEAEAAAREQAEEENKRLREEALRLRTEMMSFPLASARPGQRDWVGSVASYSAASERDFVRNANTGSSSSSTLVMELELLKQENAELRKEVSAQTSMLTSRNREKERLYQEIEELKLGQRRDGSRSVAGDSIFDRSASRAHGRPSSRASDGTGQSPGDEAEREDLEVRIGELRDQVSALKLDNQAVREQAEEYLRELEAVDKAYQADLAEERNEAFQHLRSEAQEEIDTVGEELDQKVEECQQLNEELRVQDENLRALQAEMRSASEGIIRLEEDAQNNLQRYKAVQQELEDCNREMETLGKSLYESNTKVQRLTVQIESSQNEIAFLREEQDGDKIRIGDLESELKTYRLALQSEKDKAKELEERLAEERHQREVVGNREKQEVQRIINELNREASAAKEEVRKLRKSLSAQEIDTNTWRERLMDLENNLRETLGDLTGSRSSLISNIMKLQKELESTALELESTRSKLDEKESLLRNRDALLESHGLESRKLAELLDRERQARRADKQSFDQALKSHHQASRTITQNNSRISDLENARNQDRKRFTTIEQQFKDQLSERNAMLLTIWKRLSSMCGPDWAHSNSLINGNLPSQEVIGNILFWPGFSRNLLLAVKTLENVVLGFKARIKGVERDLAKQYQSLEHTFSLRVKKLDRLEESMMNMRAQQHNRSLSGVSPETAKLRGENRLLKAELNLLQSHSRSRGSTLAEATDGALVHGSRPHPLAADPANSERWIQRLRELEKRLKAEREARILDRSGARKRLEERDAENQRLRAQLERRRLHHDVSTRTSSLDGDGGRPMRVPAPRQLDSSDPGTSDGYERHRDDEPSSSGEEGIYVDIEV
ncbi:putative anucleate primary sterigmata [Aspergillus violaceofuscus CBS 115571]|uniref:Putative anucleate primary sterigmata n=1 Tax=Aspergillus violaceofuscus (strain CBS 115571) TaxID=1450538 RepID=A0A2V5HIJ5_ASPV1|nr:putative anucleate primary sterigmata [Aspergillus violaceofuscus CBS 115571]